MKSEKAAILLDPPANESLPDALDVLDQAAAVGKTLEELGWQVRQIPCLLNLEKTRQELLDYAPDLVFNLVESIAGCGNLLHLAPALLDHLGLPYTGADTAALFITGNKLSTKQSLAAAGLPTPAWHQSNSRADNFQENQSYIIKPVWEDASLGIDLSSVVSPAGPEDLDRALAARIRKDGRPYFAEVYIPGREFNLSLLDGRVLPPAEILFLHFSPGQPRILDYQAKWEKDSQAYVNTPRSFSFTADDQRLLEQLTELAARCWDLFALSGYARVDFRVDPQGRPFILEINANPCIAPDSGFVAAAEKAGLNWNELIGVIVASGRKKNS